MTLDVLLRAEGRRMCFEDVERAVKEALPNASANAVRQALSRFANAGAVLVEKERGTFYRAASDARRVAGGRRTTRTPSVIERSDPEKMASTSEYAEAAAVELVVHGPTRGPQLHERLVGRLKERGKLEDKYLSSNLGHHPGFENWLTFVYWLRGVTVPGKERAILDEKGKGSRAGRPRKKRSSSSS